MLSIGKEVKILLIEESIAEAHLIEEFLREKKANIRLRHLYGLEGIKEILISEDIDVILLDIYGRQGIERIKKVKKESKNIPIVVLTARIDEEFAVECIQAGAEDYLLKRKLDSHQLIRAIRYAIERKKSQEALRQSEDRLYGLAANLPGVIYQFRVSPEGEISVPYISASCRSLCEMEPEEIQQNWQQIFKQIHPDERLEFEKSIASTSEQQPWRCEWRQITPSGKIRWLQGACKIKKQPNGEIIGDGLVMDITELREAEKERDRFFTLSLDLLCIVGFDGYFKRINPAWLNTLGYTTAELLAKPAIEFVYPDDRETALAQIQKLKQGTPQSNFEIRFLCKDGSYKWLSWTAAPYAEEGTIYAVARDITEQKRAEEALRESQRFIQQIAEISPNILYVYDLLDDRNIYINAGFSQILGYTQEEIQAMNGAVQSNLIHPDDFAKLSEHYQQFQTGKENEIKEIEYRMRHKNGEWRWLLSRDTVFSRTPEGQPKQILATALDITEKKRAAEELAKSARQSILRSDIGLALAQSDWLTMLSECALALVRYFDVAFAGIWTLWGYENILELQASAGMYSHLGSAHARVPVGSWQIGAIAAEQKPYLSNNIQNHPNISDFESAKREGMVAFVGYPLIVEKQLVGVMAMFSRHPLSEEVLEDLALIAYEIAVGIERKRTLFALQQNRERLQLALEGSALGLWDWNIATGEIYFDEQWKKMLGYEVTEIENNFEAWDRLVHPEDLPQLVAAISSHLEARTPVCEVEFRMKSAEGTWKWILCHGKVFEWDECGLPVRMTGTHKDISDRKLLEYQLISSYAEMNAVFEAIVDIILVIDADCNQITIAPTKPARLASSEIDIISPTVEQFFIGERVEIFSGKVQEAIASKQTVNFEYSLKIGNSEYWFFASISPLSEQAAIWVARDITELKQTELNLLRVKEAAEAASRAKSTFIANMSHELRTPLNGILGYAQLLKAHHDLTAEQQESISNILQCGNHLLMLIEDVLDLSKIEARKMELYPTEVNFPSFIKSIADLFRMRAAQKNISFEYQQLSCLPACVRADEKRLRQVLINLLSNAVKFTEKGSVIFQVGVLKSQELSNSTNPILKIRFQVEDTGIGIPSSKLKEIFLPFHQVGERTHLIEGTGLGLAISQKLVQMMGSEIIVSSTIGHGSVFYFDLDLPVVDGFCPQPPQPLKQQRRIIGFKGDKRKVLIVDDERLNRAILQNLLSRLGFQVFTAIDGQDCLHKAVEFQPDIILIDLLMPVMDGFETVRRLRQLPPLKDVPIIALSASVFEATQQECLGAGCDNFLPKPIQTSQLLELLQTYLGIEWIYEQLAATDKKQGLGQIPASSSSPNSHPQPSITPPEPEIIATLLKMAAIGDIEEIIEETKRLENTNPKYAPFVSKIRQFAKGFQVKQLKLFLKQHLAIPTT